MRYIDTHCHIDMLSNPQKYLIDSERVSNITFGMTNLPSHFQMGKSHFQNLKYSRQALGFHPLLAAENLKEIYLFKKLVNETSYIGEIGLDFSKEGLSTRDCQVKVLDDILEILEGKHKIISVHSRRAETELLQMLVTHNIKKVIFHWYTGKVSLIPDIIKQGYYFSINESMCMTESGKRIISSIPIDRILTETDAPFNKHSKIYNTYKYLNSVGCSPQQIEENFYKVISYIR